MSEFTRQIIVGVLLLIGSGFMSMASFGLVRMPDLLLRMHAATKAGTIGAGFLLLALAVHSGELQVITTCIAAIFFLIATAPVAAHLIARAGYFEEVELWDHTATDEVMETYEEPHIAPDPRLKEDDDTNTDDSNPPPGGSS